MKCIIMYLYKYKAVLIKKNDRVTTFIIIFFLNNPKNKIK